MPVGFKKADDTRIYATPSGGSAINKIIALGDRFALTLETIASGGSGVCLLRGEIEYAKYDAVSGAAWTPGAVLYYDASEDEFTTDDDSGTNLRAGIAAAAALTAATTGRILLNA